MFDFEFTDSALMAFADYEGLLDEKVDYIARVAEVLNGMNVVEVDTAALNEACSRACLDPCIFSDQDIDIMVDMINEARGLD